MPKTFDSIYSIEVELNVWEVANSETSSCSAWYNSTSILDALAHILWLANFSRTTLAGPPSLSALGRVSERSEYQKRSFRSSMLDCTNSTSGYPVSCSKRGNTVGRTRCTHPSEAPPWRTGGIAPIRTPVHRTSDRILRGTNRFHIGLIIEMYSLILGQSP